MENPTAKILTTPEYLEVLTKEHKMTFATFVDGHEVHHQINIIVFDTREKIEEEMARILVQVTEELRSSNNIKRHQPVPENIQKLIDEHRNK
jgi:hypothetical protein